MPALITKRDVVREALKVLHESSAYIGLADRRYENRIVKSDAKNGGNVDIRLPQKFDVADGVTLVKQGYSDAIRTLSVNKRKHIGMDFTDTDLTLSIDDFSARYIKPAVQRLARKVDQDIAQAMLVSMSQRQVKSSVSAAIGLSEVTKANALLSAQLAEKDGRRLCADAMSQADTVNAIGNYFNPTKEISGQYVDGVMGYAGGFHFLETENTPTVTFSGTITASAMNTAVAQGATTIALTGITGTATQIVAGQAFTIAGVFEVDPETLQSIGRLKVFVAAANATITGGNATVTLDDKIVAGVISSGIVTGPDNANNLGLAVVNCFVANATTSNAIPAATRAGTFLEGAAGANTSGRLAQGIAKNAFALATVDLELDESMHGARESFEGVSIRLAKGYDHTNSTVGYRLDILYGIKVIRPEHIVGVFGSIQ